MVKPWGPGIQKPRHESGPKQQRNQKSRTSNHKQQQSSTNRAGRGVGGVVTKVQQKEETNLCGTESPNTPALNLNTEELEIGRAPQRVQETDHQARERSHNVTVTAFY